MNQIYICVNENRYQQLFYIFRYWLRETCNNIEYQHTFLEMTYDTLFFHFIRMGRLDFINYIIEFLKKFDKANNTNKLNSYINDYTYITHNDGSLRTPLMLSVSMGMFNIITRLLMENGAFESSYVLERNDEQCHKTAFHLAFKGSSDVEILANIGFYLWCAGAIIKFDNVRSNLKYSSLSIAEFLPLGIGLPWIKYLLNTREYLNIDENYYDEHDLTSGIAPYAHLSCTLKKSENDHSGYDLVLILIDIK